ncbi:MAG: biopolymer transporter ExbD [Zoogloeaceae bacterium]|jgi:biopolymer transport protein ExbD|nr:biopolymer transporter ExbD [Zoogloeaceae bacterium]
MLPWEDEPRRKARIEIIPMIDVMMFLLVFFVLISLHVIPALGFKTSLPGASAPERFEVRKHALISISSAGTFQLDGSNHTLASLKAALVALKRESPDADIVINSDREASVQAMVDAMDAAKSAGITAIAVAANRK